MGMRDLGAGARMGQCFLVVINIWFAVSIVTVSNFLVVDFHQPRTGSLTLCLQLREPETN